MELIDIIRDHLDNYLNGGPYAGQYELGEVTPDVTSPGGKEFTVTNVDTGTVEYVKVTTFV